MSNGFVKRDELPNLKRITRALDISKVEITTLAATETVLRQVTVPANYLKRGEHLRIQLGGFGLAVGGGNLTNAQLIARFGTAGALLSPPIFDTGVRNPAANITTFFGEVILTHDSGTPDFGGLGGWMAYSAPAVVAIGRGEIVADFTVENILYFNAIITGGVTPTIVSETWEVLKHSMYPF